MRLGPRLASAEARHLGTSKTAPANFEDLNPSGLDRFLLAGDGRIEKLIMSKTENWKSKVTAKWVVRLKRLAADTPASRDPWRARVGSPPSI